MIYVRDLLKLDTFKDFELVSGENGLDRGVSWPNVAQTVSIREWLVGGDVILMSGVGLKITDEFLTDIVIQAADGRAACIIMLINPEPIVLPIYAALTSIPSVLLFIRRLHDCGYSGWWVFPAIVPPICFFVMCWAPDPAQPNKYGTTERLPSKNLRAKTVPPLIDGIEYLTPPPMPFEPAVKRREELFEKEQKEIIEQEKVPNSKETQNEKDIRQTGQKD